MAIDISELQSECAHLRNAQESMRSALSQAEAVDVIVRWADLWRDLGSPFRREAQLLGGSFSWEMVDCSLTPLVESLTLENLWELIDAEGVRGMVGPALIGHVIAANTPLLSWASLLRGLLLRSAAVVKLPSGPTAAWAEIFQRSLATVSPILAESISLLSWPGGTESLDACLCQNVDTLVAYGNDAAISELRGRCPANTTFVGYGHRVSFGLMLRGIDWKAAADGFSRDVLLYEQGGCLSAQTVFIEGDFAAARSFGAELANALANSATRFPQAARSAGEAARVREARALARMEPSAAIWEDADLRWTVIARSDEAFVGSPGHGVVSVQPIQNMSSLPVALHPIIDRLQGCAIAGGEAALAAQMLSRLGVSRICASGDLQRPPFSWREDGRDLLRSLLPGGIENQ